MQPTEEHANKVLLPDTLVVCYSWLAYLLEEHAMLGYIELF